MRAALGALRSPTAASIKRADVREQSMGRRIDARGAQRNVVSQAIDGGAIGVRARDGVVHTNTVTTVISTLFGAALRSAHRRHSNVAHRCAALSRASKRFRRRLPRQKCAGANVTSTDIRQWVDRTFCACRVVFRRCHPTERVTQLHSSSRRRPLPVRCRPSTTTCDES